MDREYVSNQSKGKLDGYFFDQIATLKKIL